MAEKKKIVRPFMENKSGSPAPFVIGGQTLMIPPGKHYFTELDELFKDKVPALQKKVTVMEQQSFVMIDRMFNVPPFRTGVDIVEKRAEKKSEEKGE